MQRFRADLKATQPGLPAEELEQQVKAYAQQVQHAATAPYPKDHAACLEETKGRPGTDCTLVVGDVMKPVWFDACSKGGGVTMQNNVPEGTPLHPDKTFCMKTFPRP